MLKSCSEIVRGLCISCGGFGSPSALQHVWALLGRQRFPNHSKDLLKVMVSFILLFKAGSVEAARSYLLPSVAVPLGGKANNTRQIVWWGSLEEDRDENVSEGMKFKGGGGRITGQAVTPALRSIRLSPLHCHGHGQSGWSCWVSCHTGCWVPSCQLCWCVFVLGLMAELRCRGGFCPCCVGGQLCPQAFCGLGGCSC